MISANNVTLRIGKKALFEDVNIKFTEGNCYGLIGANGAGKSTFLKILTGQIEPSKGDVSITPGQRLSFLEQDHFKYDEYNVLDTVIMGNDRLYQIMKEKEAIYAKEDFTEEDGNKASELEAEFADMNGWEAESDAAQLLNGLGIAIIGVGYLFYAAIDIMRGGEKASVLWLIVFAFLLTMGEMFFSPLGHSFISKYSPSRYLAVMMSVWGFATFIAAKSYGPVYGLLFGGKIEFKVACIGVAVVSFAAALIMIALDKKLSALVD